LVSDFYVTLINSLSVRLYFLFHRRFWSLFCRLLYAFGGVPSAPFLGAAAFFAGSFLAGAFFAGSFLAGAFFAGGASFFAGASSFLAGASAFGAASFLGAGLAAGAGFSGALEGVTSVSFLPAGAVGVT
jgi:hypothetical protein